MSRPISVWTDEQVQTLIGLWKQGFTASQIAKEMRLVSRNAVIGKVHRLKLTRDEGDEVRIKYRIKPRKVVRKQKRGNPSAREQRSAERKRNREISLTYNSSKTSSAYRKYLPKLRPMTRAELRDMLTTAVQNTADMEPAE